MNENITKLHRKAAAHFSGITEDLAKEGATESDIMRTFDSIVQGKIRAYYKQLRKPMHIGSVIMSVLEIRPEGSAESKAELIFSHALDVKGISYKSQYKIGQYRADFLISEFLVVEIDGPHHNTPEQKAHDVKRDKFIRELGYKILRVPIWLLAMDQSAVLDEIQEIIRGAGG